jgi:hypothetical protein
VRTGLEPRAPPGQEVRLSAGFKSLILDTYPLPVGTEMLLNIEVYVDLLNSRGRNLDAIGYLRDCEIGARAEGRRRSQEKGRTVLTLVGTSTITASLTLAAKYIGAKLGIS